MERRSHFRDRDRVDRADSSLLRAPSAGSRASCAGRLADASRSTNLQLRAIDRTSSPHPGATGFWFCDAAHERAVRRYLDGSPSVPESLTSVRFNVALSSACARRTASEGDRAIHSFGRAGGGAARRCDPHDGHEVRGSLRLFCVFSQTAPFLMEEQQQDNPLGMSGSVIKAFKNELIMFMIT